MSCSYHVIVHQIDLEAVPLGGIDTSIRDIIRFARPEDDFAVIGTSRDPGRLLWKWQMVSVGGRLVRFMPIVRLDPRNQRRRIPHSLRLAVALAIRRPALSRAALI